MVTQEAVTIRAPIRREARAALDSALVQVSADVEANPLVPFARLAGVHFGRFVILEDAEVNGRIVPASLVYAANVDALSPPHLDDLAALGTGLDEIWGCCDGYPDARARSHVSRRQFLDSHRITTHAFYTNTVGRTVNQARHEAVLRDALQGQLDQLQRASWTRPRSAEDVDRTLREQCSGAPTLSPMLKPARSVSLGWRAKEAAVITAALLGALLLSPLLLIGGAVWLLALRSHEKRDALEPLLRLTAFRRGQIAIAEDQVVQNQFSAVGCIKPFLIRRASVRVLLIAADFATRHYFNKGDLGTFRPLGLHGVDTIHFAQWLIIDHGYRVLFLSNYDGSLTSYMDDFINKVAWGLNAVFSHGESYPPTRWLVLDGASDEQTFKAFLQSHQLPTQAWYSAYKDATALNLTNNSAIRAGLASGGSSTQWTQCL